MIFRLFFHFQECPRLDDDDMVILLLLSFLPLVSPELNRTQKQILFLLLLRVIPKSLSIDLGTFHQSKEWEKREKEMGKKK